MCGITFRQRMRLGKHADRSLLMARWGVSAHASSLWRLFRLLAQPRVGLHHHEGAVDHRQQGQQRHNQAGRQERPAAQGNIHDQLLSPSPHPVWPPSALCMQPCCAMGVMGDMRYTDAQQRALLACDNGCQQHSLLGKEALAILAQGKVGPAVTGL